MRKFTFYFLLLYVYIPIYAQDTLVRDLKQDFITPDHPAFKIMDVDPSVILRPSNVKEFSSITSDYFQKPAYVIPKAFSMEISPALLFRSNKLTLKDYKDHFAAFSCRISVATHAVDDKWQKNEVGIGFRMTVLDKGDFRTDTIFLRKLREAISAAHKLREENEELINEKILKETEYLDMLKPLKIYKYIEKFKEQNSGKKPSAKEIADTLRLAEDEVNDILINETFKTFNQRATKEKLNDYIVKRKEELLTVYFNTPEKYKSMEVAINNFRKKFIADNWNATRLDWGIATKLGTPDSNFNKNLRYDKFSFWLTGAIRVGDTLGKGQSQLMVGININHEYKGLEKRDTVLFNVDSTTYNRISYAASLRYYLGTNRIKAFLEAQLGGSYTTSEKHLDLAQNIVKKSSENKLNFLLNAGAEINVSDGIWILANIGYKTDHNFSEHITTSSFVYKVDFRFNLPQKFKLF